LAKANGNRIYHRLSKTKAPDIVVRGSFAVSMILYSAPSELHSVYSSLPPVETGGYSYMALSEPVSGVINHTVPRSSNT